MSEEPAQPGPRPALATGGVTKVYGSGEVAVHALRGVDLELQEGEAQVLEGLSEGEQVVLHPSDRVTDGARIVVRSAGQTWDWINVVRR